MQLKKLIPTVLIVLLAIGVASAFLYSYVYTSTSTVNDPFTLSIYKDLPSTMYPGETATVIFEINNAAPDVTYGAVITVTLYGSASASYLYDTTTGTLTYTGTGWNFNIAPGIGYLWITVTLDPAGAAGAFYVGFQVNRVAHF